MADALFTTDDLKLALAGGDETLRRLAGDTGATDPTPDPVRVAYGIDVASEELYGILRSGFETNEKIAFLAANDPSVRHAGCMIFREVLGQGRDEFRLPDGTCVFSPDARKARDLLREKARGALRSSAEEVATNGPGRSALLRPRTATPPPSLILDRTTGRPRGF